MKVVVNVTFRGWVLVQALLEVQVQSQVMV
jgi:hypothetical protein